MDYIVLLKFIKYNRIPVAYIQRIVVKSLIDIPLVKINESRNDSSRLYLIDAFRTPLAQLFELNEFIRNFQSTSSSIAATRPPSRVSLVGDLCVHVGELAKKVRPPKRRHHSAPSISSSNEFNKHLLPEFNCLYLSPASIWSNDLGQFVNDDDLLTTLAYAATVASSEGEDEAASNKDVSKNDEASSPGFFSTLLHFIYSIFRSKY